MGRNPFSLTLAADHLEQSANARLLELQRKEAIERDEMLRDEAAARRSLMDREPLPPTKWIENPYFCGSLASDMWEPVKEEFVDVFDGNYFEVIMGGSAGWGKTTLAVAIEEYSHYLLSCYAVPQHAFRKMVAESGILFLNLNVKEDKAKRAYYKKLFRMIQATPYFKNEHPPQKGVTNELRFPKSITSTFAGATKLAAESEDLIFLVMDEVNQYDVVDKSKRALDGTTGTYDAAEVVWSAANTRLRNRFMLPDGSMPPPCKLLVVCKETYKKSFIRRRIAEVERDGLNRPGKTKIIIHSEWETKPKGTYNCGWFWIRTATRTEGAKVIEDHRRVSEDRARLAVLKQEVLAGTADKDVLFDLIKVPAVEEYILMARKNVDEFQRDFCGVPTDAINNFYGDVSMIRDSIRGPETKLPDGRSIPREVCDHPYTASSTDLSGRDGVVLLPDRLVRPVEFDDNGEPVAWKPIINPNKTRFVHIDSSLTEDATGFAMGHVAGWKTVQRVGNDPDGNRVVFEETAPVIWFDLLLQIVPPPGDEIDLAAVRAVVYRLSSLGFPIYWITMDLRNMSAGSLQAFRKKGYSAEHKSVDILPEAHMGLRTAFRERRVSMYGFPVAEDELKELERHAGKKKVGGQVVDVIDHRPDGSKDVADAMAGVCSAAEEWAAENTQRAPAPQVMAKNRPSKRAALEKAATRVEAFENGDFESLFEMGRKGGRRRR